MVISEHSGKGNPSLDDLGLNGLTVDPPRSPGTVDVDVVMDQPPTGSLTWEEYYSVVPEPAGLAETSSRVKEFISHQLSFSRRVVLITSGGTTVPLEKNMVRFVDNFSAGTRGATAAEYFIDMGYAVIFLHRQFSLQPYARNYTHSKHCFLDLLEEFPTSNNNVDAINHGNIDPVYDESSQLPSSLSVQGNHAAEMKRVFRRYNYARREKLLHIETFVTVTDYLFYLKEFCSSMALLDGKAMFFLAAAVSDFFVPPSRIAQHKIESGLGGFNLRLDPVPKILLPLVKLWCPNAYTVSFKLETNKDILIPKARRALRNYGHQLVIANMLHTRKFSVTMVERDMTLMHRKKDSTSLPSTEAIISKIDEQAAENSKLTEILLSNDELTLGVEIESKMIPFVIGRHTDWIASMFY